MRSFLTLAVFIFFSYSANAEQNACSSEEKTRAQLKTQISIILQNKSKLEGQIASEVASLGSLNTLLKEKGVKFNEDIIFLVRDAEITTGLKKIERPDPTPEQFQLQSN